MRALRRIWGEALTSPFRAGLLAICLFVAPHAAWSQSVPPSAGSLLKELRERERTAPEPSPAAPVQPPPVRPPIVLPDGATLQVNSFRITGNTLFSTEELQILVRGWLGRTLDINSLNDAAGALTRRYQSQGYILSYAYLPQQKVVDAEVEIAVLEGRVSAVQAVSAQDARLSDSVVQAHLAPANIGLSLIHI